jgi:glycerophosphoryl diester phosphodiesterase
MRQKLRVSPFLIAHRGASAERPENTIAAFDEARRQGAEAFELDVQLSKDGVPVVYHDRTLRKLGGGVRRVGTLDAAKLEGFDAGAWFGPEHCGQTIPRLSQVLDRYVDDVQLLIELKLRGSRDEGRRLARTVAQLLQDRALEERTFVLCFNEGLLEETGRTAPRARLVLNLDPPRTLTRALAARLGALHALSVDVRSLTLAFATAVRGAGVPLFTYTCNTEAAVARSLAAGAAGVMSDRPRWLRDTVTALQAAK